MVWYAGAYVFKQRMCHKFLSNIDWDAQFWDIKVGLREWKRSLVKKVNKYNSKTLSNSTHHKYSPLLFKKILQVPTTYLLGRLIAISNEFEGLQRVYRINLCGQTETSNKHGLLIEMDF